ncbi:hypothetical protein ACOMHN_000215 [Nucella lapillus]
MSDSVIIEVSGEQYRKLGLGTYISDFANILKAFIGSNFLSIPFGFGRCGLILGVLGLIVVAGLTTHCAHLLVKAKYHAIKHVLHVCLHPNNFAVKVHYGAQSRCPKNTFGSKLIIDHLIPPEFLNQKGNVSEKKEDVSEIQRRLVNTLQYADLARMCFGQFGVAVTNVAILITQLGFCINYAIFTASAVQSFFPVYDCTVQVRNNVSIFSPDCRYLVNPPWQSGMDTSMNESRTDFSAAVSYGSTTVGLENSFIPGNFTIQNNPSGFVISKDSFSKEEATSSQPGDTNRSISSIFSSASSMVAALSSASDLPVPKTAAPHLGTSTLPTPTSKSWETSESVTGSSPSSLLESSSNVTVSDSGTQTSVAIPVQKDMPVSSSSPDQTVWSVSWTDSPDIRLLFLIPVAIFVVLILQRRMRGIGLISTVGNVSLICGTLVVIVALILQFHVSDSWVWARVEGLPMFFGTVAGAFEGAGAMLPVESSMEGNRHNYAHYVTAGLTVLVLLHICTGVLSYLSFGSAIAQVVSMNLDVGSWLGVTVNVFLMVGILFTFPIMVFPVVQMAEATMFGKGRCCQKKGEKAYDEVLLMSDSRPSSGSLDAESVLRQVSPWKRNVVRIMLVLAIGLMGLLLRDSFAYVAAFVGAVGSIFVAYILPCLFHMKLCWSNLPPAIRLKDVFIVGLGVVFCVMGVYSVIKDNIL